MLYGFQLGREYKLSVAEILSVFPDGEIEFLDTDFLVLKDLEKTNILDKANNLGGTIKIIEIDNSKSILDIALESEGKFQYGISVFGEKKNLKEILIKQKKEIKGQDISSRFINKDFKNLSSAQILGEKLVKRGTDFSYIYTDNIRYFGISIWVQDINAYSKRDYAKDRDMQVGMLPPKLCQMMINISGGKTIYDPFVGLGTVLIEAVLIGSKSVYGSDLSDRMVEKSTENINSFISSNNLKIDDLNIIKLNSKFIHESEILLNNKIDSIVSEGYLGEVMTKKNISIERINKQKESLLDLYSRFFEGLNNVNYKGNLVMCFPFWEMRGVYSYFNEVYDVLNRYCVIEKIVPDNIGIQTTKSGSLLYKRDKQLVGREIFKLKMK